MWNDIGYEPLPDRALGVRRLRSGALLLAFIVVLAVVDGAVRAIFDIDVPFPPVVVPALLAVALAAGWWSWTRLSWRAWGWRLDEATFQTRSGVYTKVWKGVPRDRVQFVEVTAGPLQRWAGLATLVVRTAGVRTPAVHVEDLVAEVAERLRDELSPQTITAAGDEPGSPGDTDAPSVDAIDPERAPVDPDSNDG